MGVIFHMLFFNSSRTLSVASFNNECTKCSGECIKYQMPGSLLLQLNYMGSNKTMFQCIKTRSEWRYPNLWSSNALHITLRNNSHIMGVFVMPFCGHFRGPADRIIHISRHLPQHTTAQYDLIKWRAANVGYLGAWNWCLSNGNGCFLWQLNV